MTKQKLISLVVIAGMLVAAIFPIFHRDQISKNFYDISDISISIAEQVVDAAGDNHDGDQSETNHCETCHLFSHLYVGAVNITNVSLIGSTKHHNSNDVFNGRSTESIKRPPRFFG